MKHLYLTVILSSLLINVNGQDVVDYYFKYTPTYKKIADRFDDVNLPTDLDFNKETGKERELWILNQDMEQTGGSTVTIENPGEAGQWEQHLRDANAWHFMALPTALAFGDAGAWANTAGIYSANHNGTPFTGPSLWSADRTIYAQPSGGNGSHLDMLHQTPYGLGIAWDSGNKYWVVDGQNGNVISYDFKQDHGPGNDYHGDAVLRRFTEVGITMNGSLPGHCALDKSTGNLYIVDPGGKRVISLNTYSGLDGNTLTPYGEALASYKEVTGASFSTVIDQGLTEPVGIALANNRLMVSDHDNGNIYVYDISGGGADLMGTIATGAGDIMGITIGPDGRLWYVDHDADEAWKINLPENLPPLATNDNVTTGQDQSVLFDILYNDFDAEGDTLSYSIVTPTTNGQTAIQSDMTIEYTPNSGWNGVDEFTYALCSSDTTEGCDTATVRITVSALAGVEIEVIEKGMVYPNPGTGSFRFTGDYVSYEIYNVLGAVAQSGNLNSNIINAQGLSRGVYLFKLTAANGAIHTEEVVILN